MHRFVVLLLCCSLFEITSFERVLGQDTSVAEASLSYAPAPADNPLKGLVPYASATNGDRFPHSMEFQYLPLSDLVVGEEKYDWRPLDNLLNEIAGRRHQAVFRVWMEYPGHSDGIPQYLETQGVKVVEWLNTNTAPFPPKKCRTPDYSDPRVRAMLTKFIGELGRKYDGDPRIGFITAGLLGTWGEWHTYPREDLMASKEVQAEVMDAYEAAFAKTPILLRYPAGEDAYAHAPNHQRQLGYHDDSFAWATLDTGKPEDSWFYMPSLVAAGAEAIDKWRSSPIGGEIRPELWGQIFDERPADPQAQDFATCVRETHVSWLMDTGMFQEKPSQERFARAVAQVQRMGYEFHVASAELSAEEDGQRQLRLKVENRGVAPFYYDWQVELAFFADGNQRPLRRVPTTWSVIGLLPDEPARGWEINLRAEKIPAAATRIGIRIVNPLKNGLPLFFANAPELQIGDGWLQVASLP